MPTKSVTTAVLLLTIALSLTAINVVGFEVDNPKHVTKKSTSAKQFSDFLWQKRLVLIHSDTQPPLTPFMWELDYESLTERKLAIYALINQQSFQLLPNTVMRRTPTMDQVLMQKLTEHQIINSNSAILIGLDGDIKATYQLADLSYKHIKALIDTMPMRQAELR
ncbi:DUF4174 domain-containing protein [Thalassotalea euphylliae]|uniref:DUF4174 domain-containing protein n=1 Tax=Thalassotalea euphylliae TaxID=1655234 RepID=A0A3E0UHX3_9GAMM|nr:DUF4174 domain-containing protein [Thalassotalea euphylliae]REL36207.1 DUF4174 domain-containing protein [Thalassotalea euphylliae]